MFWRFRTVWASFRELFRRVPKKLQGEWWTQIRMCESRPQATWSQRMVEKSRGVWCVACRKYTQSYNDISFRISRKMSAKKKATSSPTFTLAAGPWVESLACHISLRIGKMTLIFNIEDKWNSWVSRQSLGHTYSFIFPLAPPAKFTKDSCASTTSGCLPARISAVSRYGGLQSCELRQRDGTPCALKICPKGVIWIHLRSWFQDTKMTCGSWCIVSQDQPCGGTGVMRCHQTLEIRDSKLKWFIHIDPCVTLTLSQQGCREIHPFAI